MTIALIVVGGRVTLLLLLYKGRCGQTDEQQVVVGRLFRNGLVLLADGRTAGRCSGGRTGQWRIAIRHAAVGHTEQH